MTNDMRKVHITKIQRQFTVDAAKEKLFGKIALNFKKFRRLPVRNLQAGDLQFLRNCSVSVFFTFHSGKFQRNAEDCFYMILLISEISLSFKMNAVSSGLHFKQVSGEFVS